MLKYIKHIILMRLPLIISVSLCVVLKKLCTFAVETVLRSIQKE